VVDSHELNKLKFVGENDEIRRLCFTVLRKWSKDRGNNQTERYKFKV